MTDPLRTLDQRQRRDIRALYTTLADAVENAVTRQLRTGDGSRPITEADRQAIMREVDHGLDVLWGHERGADSAIRQIVTRDTRAARLQPLNDAVRRWKNAMGRRLWERVRQEAIDG